MQKGGFSPFNQTESCITGRYTVAIEQYIFFSCNHSMEGIRLTLDRPDEVCLVHSYPTHFSRVQQYTDEVTNQRNGCVLLRHCHQRVFLAAKSAAELPLMPTWVGSQTKTPFHLGLNPSTVHEFISEISCHISSQLYIALQKECLQSTDENGDSLCEPTFVKV